MVVTRLRERRLLFPDMESGMKPIVFRARSAACLGVALAWATLAAAQQSAPWVSAQGRLTAKASSLSHESPLGGLELRVEPVEGGFHRLLSQVEIRTTNGTVQRLSGVPGDAFFATDVGRFLSIETCESSAVGSRLRVWDLNGVLRQERRVSGLSDPAVSPDGRTFAWRTPEQMHLLDVASLQEVRLPQLDRYVLGPGGRTAGLRLGSGRLLLAGRGGRGLWRSVPTGLRGLTLDLARDRLLLWDAQNLHAVALPAGSVVPLRRFPEGEELMDVRVVGDRIEVGLRVLAEELYQGRSLTLSPEGATIAMTRGAALSRPLVERGPLPVNRVAWPLEPQVQHPVGNTYAEFQDYGGAPYMHPGVDVMGAPGDPVYAVRSGVVKAILTTSGVYHWRVAIGDSASAQPIEGYLYAHLDQPTIAVSVGDTVQAGQYLGDLVGWPVANFTHTHFNRIQDQGTVWSGGWLCTENSHARFFPQTESEAPVFENALGADLFAFAANGTSAYLDPSALAGAVDIIAHVGDRVASSWVCSVQSLRYSIWPVGSPQTPVVSDRLSVSFDMDLDTYLGGPIDPMLVGLLYREDATLDTEGDYDDREFFHILTNSNGDDVYEASDAAEAWDTTTVGNGDYVIEVTARDTAGNATTASMTVTVDNP